MNIGAPREIAPGEQRVALVPEVARKLVKRGVRVLLEASAGAAAGFLDGAYAEVGAELVDGPDRIWAEADILLKVQGPQERPDGRHEIELVREGQILLGFLNPLFRASDMQRLAERKAVAFAIEAIPRTSRAQAMDALSSQANLAGYKAVLLAANRLQKLLPLVMTAAGTICPAKVLVLGAGVAGLSAIATARRLGAVVHAYDVRPAAREEVLSLGARFVDLEVGEPGEGKGGYARALSEEAQRRQRERLGAVARDMDIVISTAAVPGRRAPLLLARAAVEAMRPGSVLVDLAAPTGGNIEGSRPDEEVRVGGAILLGPTNLPSAMAHDASLVYARNALAFVELLVDQEGRLSLDFQDDVLAGSCITRGGEVVHPGTREKLGEGAQAA